MQINLLGTPHFIQDGTPLSGFVSDKVRAVLFVVACHTQPVPRGELIALIWGDFARKQALQNLRVALNNLKRLLGERIIVTRETVALHDVDVDVRQFLACVKQGQHAAAVALYQGELCAGFALADAAAFESWLLLERERFAHLTRKLLGDLADAALRDVDIPQAIAWVRRQVALDPLDEVAQCRLIALLARQGDYVTALQQGEQLRALLAADLDLPPEPQTEALLSHIRRARTLPRPALEPAGTLFGRDRERANLARRLSPVNPDRERFITLVGLGGMGKTRLALAVASDLQTQFLDGVVLLPLAAINDLSGVVNTLAQALQIEQRGTLPLRAQVETALRERDLLLLLDNCEQLVTRGLGDWVRTLLQGAPNLAVLATSRQAIGGESVFMLDGLASAEAGANLFLSGVRQLHYDFSPSPTERAAVNRIVDLTAGMPLALNLAAAQADFFTCQQIAAEIASDLDALATARRDVPQRQRTIRAVLDYAWRQLPTEQQQTFAALGVLHDPFSAAAAHAIAHASPGTLHSLQRSAMLSALDGEYTMHDLLRHYAQQQSAPQQHALARAAHAAYFADWVHAQELQIVGGQPATLRGYARRQNDIAAAWQTAVAHRNSDQIARLLRGFSDYHFLRNMRETLRAALQAAAHIISDPVVAGRITTQLAALDHVEGNLTRARTLILQAIGELSTAPRWLAYALARYAAIETDEGQSAHAAELLDEAVMLFRTSGDTIGEARALTEIGLVRARLGATEIDWVMQALSLSQAADDWRGELRCQIVLGNECIGRGEYGAALAHYAAAEKLAATLEDRRNLASCAVNQGLALQMLQRHGEAQDANRRALAQFEQINDIDGVCFALKNLGALAFEQGDNAEAERQLRHALSLRRQMQGRLQGWLELHQLALVAFAQGRVAAGAQYATTVLRRLGEANYEAAILYSVAVGARALLAQRDWQTATSLLAHAIAQPTMEAQQRAECVALLAHITDGRPQAEVTAARQTGENGSLATLIAATLAALAQLPDSELLT